MTDVAIYGAGGFGKEVACLINWINTEKPTWNIVGFFDDGVTKGTAISHFGSVLGDMDELNRYPMPLSVVFAIGNCKIVNKLVNGITNTKIDFPNLIAPNFIVRDVESFKIGQGNIIQGGCVATCDVSIGDFNVLNGDVKIGHDVKIGSYNTIMPAVRISGEVVLGNNNFLGVGSMVLQQIRIKNNTKLAAGSVLMTKPKEDSLYIGVPAKLFKL